MKIYTKLEYTWNGKQYVLDSSEWFEYNGPVVLACGPSAAEQSAAATQTAFSNQLMQQATQVFQGASQVFQSLQNTFMPTVAAGPNQQGFSPQELSVLNSQAITSTGQSYQHAKAAVGNAAAATGGNQSLPSGAAIGEDVTLASNAANQTSNELNQITQQNYAVGRQNYQNATAGLAGSVNAFNPATTASNSADSALTNSFNDQSTMTNQSDSWINATIGALGGIAGAATGGLLKRGGSSSFDPGESSGDFG